MHGRLQRLSSGSLSEFLLYTGNAKTEAKDSSSQQHQGIHPGSLKPDRQAAPSAEDTKLKLQTQLLDPTSSTSNETNQTGDLQTNSSTVPLRAGWSSMFKSQLSAAANGFQNRAQTGASTAANQTSDAARSSSQIARPKGAAVNQTFPWTQRMVEMRVCDDSCDKAVSLLARCSFPSIFC